MSIRIIVIAFFISLQLTGCIPKVRIVQPQITGTVIDTVSNKPIANVLISEDTKSQKDGTFKIEAVTELGIAMPVGGVYPIEKYFAIGKKGYLPRVCIFRTLTTIPASEHTYIKLMPSNTSIEQNQTILQQLIITSSQHNNIKSNSYALPPDNIHQKVVCSALNHPD